MIAGKGQRPAPVQAVMDEQKLRPLDAGPPEAFHRGIHRATITIHRRVKVVITVKVLADTVIAINPSDGKLRDGPIQALGFHDLIERDSLEGNGVHYCIATTTTRIGPGCSMFRAKPNVTETDWLQGV